MGGCGSKTLFSSSPGRLWQDRQIKWDQPKHVLALRPGEVLVKEYAHIEDTKGENGLGRLQITNLRVIWQAVPDTNVRYPGYPNISLGLGNICHIHFNMTESVEFGRTRAAQIMTQMGPTKFEFTFGSSFGMDLFHDLDTAFRRYKATNVFRDLTLRDASLVTDDGAGVVFYGENFSAEYARCSNLTSSEQYLGTLTLTTHRLIWCSSRDPAINVSVPFFRLRSVSMRRTRVGKVLVLETSRAAGAFVLGFLFQTQTDLFNAQTSMVRFLRVLEASPSFGPSDGCTKYENDRLVVVSHDSMKAGDSPLGSFKDLWSPCSLDLSITACHSLLSDISSPESSLRKSRSVHRPSDKSSRFGSLKASFQHQKKLPVMSPSTHKYLVGSCHAASMDSAHDPSGHLCCCAQCLRSFVCMICLSCDKERLKRLPCMHVFHETCINEWLLRSTFCPICKSAALEK